MKIAIDLDDTIVDWSNYFYDLEVRELGRYVNYTDNVDDELKQKYIELIKRNIRQYHRYGKPFDGALAKIREWHNAGHEIIIITARGMGWLELSSIDEKDDTIYWLLKNKVPYDALVFTEDKGRYAKDLGINIFLEDSVSMCENIIKLSSNTKVFAKRNDYNRSLSGKVAMFDTFDEINIE